MAMAFYTGSLKELGPSVEEAHDRIRSKLYSYVELGDGQRLRNITVVGGLDGKLDGALDHENPIELHVMQGGKKSDLLVALKSGDGQIFATDLGGGSLLGYGMVASLSVLGLCLIPLFGVGLVLLWLAWRTWHGLRLVELARKHVRTLPTAIFV